MDMMKDIVLWMVVLGITSQHSRDIVKRLQICKI